MANDEVKLLVSIVDRGKGTNVAALFHEHGLPFNYLCMGTGTANSKMLDYLGLSETLKDIVLAFAPSGDVRAVMRAVNARFDFSHPGRGILFSMPLTGVSGQIHQSLTGDCALSPKEEPMECKSDFDLVLAVIERGYVDVVMDAARSCGASGGTVLHGRRTAIDEGENLLGVMLEPERDIVAIVVAHDQKLEVMRAVNKVAGASTPARGVLVALPVEEMMGLRTPVVQESPCEGAE